MTERFGMVAGLGPAGSAGASLRRKSRLACAWDEGDEEAGRTTTRRQPMGATQSKRACALAAEAPVSRPSPIPGCTP